MTAVNIIAKQQILQWFAARGWRPWSYQEAAWEAYAQGRSGLIHVPTGAGKTYAAFFGPLLQLMQAPETPGLQVLLITPLRSLSRDTEKALRQPIEELGLDVALESRTGDTKASLRKKQRERLPQILITTPESLALLLSYPEAQQRFAHLRAVILDEWHELMGSKRGVQMELNLARIRQFNPRFQIWALSATMADPEQAAQCAVGMERACEVIRADIPRPVILEPLIPDELDSFPWAGHLGLTMRERLLDALDITKSTLIFTNTRFQAERWFQEILAQRPEWAGLVALHHGSVEESARRFVEDALKDGRIKLVVCTSSLDLGVDFPAVEAVFQIGSPKGIARLMQRAGRARHRAGESCHITCVPTNALQLLEFAATRQAIESGRLENRPQFENAFDVLAQHMVTCAAGGGFDADALYRSVTSAWSYQKLTREQFDWTLQLVEHGGANLAAYPEYHKVTRDGEHYRMSTERLAKVHRMNLGTIGSDTQMAVQFLKGQRLGYMEESFLSRLKRGDRFVFAGRTLELFRIEDNVALVRLSQQRPNAIAKWAGSRLPISEPLSAQIRAILSLAPTERKTLPELAALAPVLLAQARLSALPSPDELLIETCKTREGYHLFLYPFEGRLVHEGLAPLLALRMARRQSASFALSVDDYGIEILCRDAYDYQQVLIPALLTTEGLVDDILESLNISTMAKRQFRDIARIAGLVQQNYPGNRKTARTLQTSASLLFEVFTRYDPDNLLLKQARAEILAHYFEHTRLSRCLQRLAVARWQWHPVTRPTPFGFPILTERISARLSNESLTDRIAKLKQRWQKL